MTGKINYFYCSIFFQYLALGMIFPIVAAWQNQEGLNFNQIGWIFGLGLAVLLVLDPISSYLSDIYDKKIVVMMGLFCLIASSIVLLFGAGVGTFTLFVILQNTGLAILSGTQESLLHDSWSKDQGSFTKLISRMHIYDEIGAITGALLSSFFIILFNIRINFAVSALSLAISLIFTFFVSTKIKDLTQGSKSLHQSFLQLITHVQGYKRMTLIVFLGAVAILTFRSEILYQNSLLVVGFSLGAFGLIYALAKVFSVIGSSLAALFEEKWGTFKVINYLFILQTGSVALLLINYAWATVASLCLFYFAENIFRGVFRSWVLTNFPIAIKTVSLSLFNIISLGIWAFMNPFIGFTLNKNIFLAIISLIILRIVATVIMHFAKAKFIFEGGKNFGTRISSHGQ